MSEYLYVGGILFACGSLLPTLISQSTCGKFPSVSTSIYEGTFWSLPIFFVYWLLSYEQTKFYILPLFSDVLGSELIGKIYAILLITCIMTARMFHTVDVSTCVSTKDELRDFETTLKKELKSKTKK